ncbi:MAG: J domain-containing protein [Methylococcales bacterium]|nr:J domain-containing protein [Methylococcales bacterium]
MTSPYQLLGISEQSSDTEIKNAYLKAVKTCPPERDPERFQRLHQAYEIIKDQDSRLRHALFDWPDVHFDELIDVVFAQPETTVDGIEVLHELLAKISPEQVLLNHLTHRS